MSVWLAHYPDPEAEMERVSQMGALEFRRTHQLLTRKAFNLGESCETPKHFALLLYYQEYHRRMRDEADKAGHDNLMVSHSCKSQFFQEAHERACLAQMLEKFTPKSNCHAFTPMVEIGRTINNAM